MCRKPSRQGKGSACRYVGAAAAYSTKTENDLRAHKESLFFFLPIPTLTPCTAS